MTTIQAYNKGLEVAQIRQGLQYRRIKNIQKVRGSVLQKRIYIGKGLLLRAQQAAQSFTQTLKPIRDLKAELFDNVFGSDRGIDASSETRANVSDILAQLETQNPTQNSAEALQKLSGVWKLIYTTSPLAFALLGLNRLPLVTVGDIIQSIDGNNATVENKIQITVPFSRTALSTQASFDIKSPKRWNVKTNKGSIETPEILYDTIEALPNSVSVLGQDVDVTYLKGFLSTTGQQLNSLVSQLGSILSQQPNLTEQIFQNAPSTWILTTFLDDDTRVARGDGGDVYIFIKDLYSPQPKLPQSDSEQQKAGLIASSESNNVQKPTKTYDI